MIFEPIEPRTIFGVKVQGLFLRRQAEVADIYAGSSRTIVTLDNIGHELSTARASDRTRRMIEDALSPAVDRAIRAGPDGGARRDRRSSTTRSASPSPSRRSTTR